MKTYISMVVAVIATLFAVNASAWNPPPTPKPASAISDVGGTLSPEAHARLDAQLKQINAGSANELAALILPSLEGESIEDVANATFKAWGVGKKDIDNGVLVVLAMKEHKSRIETGKGVEGDLPDLKTHDILDNIVKPRMRQHKVEAALSEAFSAISSSIANHKAEAEAAKAKAATNPAPTATATTDAPTPSRPICDASGVGMSGGGWALLIMGMAALVIWMARRLTRKTSVQLAPEPVVVSKPVAPIIPPAPVRVSPPSPRPPPLPKKAKVVGIKSLPKAPPRPAPKPAKKMAVAEVVAATSIVAEVEALSTTTRARIKREREEREEESRRARRAQEERDEEDRRRKRREEDEDRSSSSSSSFDWGGGSSGGSDSGGGFGGGDSGGGGSSSDW